MQHPQRENTTRDDLRRFRELDIDCSAIGLLQDGGEFAYFCTPVDAEFVGRVGCDGIHFVLLPGDERVFCVDPSMEYSDETVLLVGETFREFLSFVLYCRGADRLSQLHWMEREQFQESLREDFRWLQEDRGRQEKNAAALDAIAQAFDLTPADPFERVRALQSGFDPSVLRFSDAYYDTLGLERPNEEDFL